MIIPDPHVEPEEILPSTVAELEDSIEPEVSPYLISFSKYKDKLCQIDDGFEKGKIKHILKLVKSIGMNSYSKSDIAKHGTVKPVVNDGPYSKLYKGIDDPEIVIEELYLSEEEGEDGRLFFFTVGNEQVFYIVAFTKDHLDTDKGSNWENKKWKQKGRGR